MRQMSDAETASMLFDEVAALRAENSRLRIALETIAAADQRVSGTNSEDHWQEDGPMAGIARQALINGQHA